MGVMHVGAKHPEIYQPFTNTFAPDASPLLVCKFVIFSKW